MPYPPISPTELEILISEDPRVRVVDVRTGGEFESAHIPGAYNVPLDALGEHQRDIVELGEPVVLVCQSGARACRAEDALVVGGMDNVRVLAGGMNAWQQEGREVVTIKARWPMERQVRLTAGAIVLASVVTSMRFPKAKWVAGGIGAGLALAALSDTCAMGMVLAKLPYNRPAECNVEANVARLREGANQEVAA